MNILNQKHLRDEQNAVEFVESIIWKSGKVCPHCKNGDQKKIWRCKKSNTARIGLHTCVACNKQFTVRIGTIFESSRLPLYKWLQVIHLFSASKKGVSIHQIHRMLDIAYKTAWHMLRRLRLACDESGNFEMFGVVDKKVEADETYSMIKNYNQEDMYINLVTNS